MKQLLKALGAIALGWLCFQGYSFFKIMKLAPHFRAKLYCTCYYVMQQNQSFCSEWSQNPIVPSRFLPVEIGNEKFQIKVKTLLGKASAAYHGPTEGCVLE